ncbi:hypothetical protein PLESTB_001747900 [Pleodorina starrii]|uniref:Patatin n=1 Tax=Pleodorina starrii TaxID=330485 RepID=A0A9W6F9K6_9CHLO|nr:hypothetical protein PLESTM_001671600 [Pleodorina starrii]GLC61363.1 hypothetical protein PLESTB_001747900 [Pleodorina starrii]GLC69326.1 hypothetical protein PLESTF_000817000 [Pleodorina starrii]
MDIIDQIEIPSFERRNAHFRRNFALAAGCVGLFYALEQYNGSISRTWKSVRRGLTAAVAAWLEDHGGFPLFSMDGEEPPQLYHNALDLNGLCGPRLSHEYNATTSAAAAYLSQNPNQQHQQHIPGLHRESEAGAGGLFGGLDANVLFEGGPAAAAAHLFASADTPSFFQSTKFFACLDVEEARELFRATRRVSLAPHEVLFRSGDPSDSGIYIVLHGTLGVFLEDPTHNTPPIHANTLRSGESVGDLDVVDGAVRTVSCMALESGCLLVNVPRELFMDFVHSHPRALMLYLQQGLARLWRVAHFVLADFLQLQLYRPKPPGSALAAETAAAATAAATAAGGRQPNRAHSNPFGHDQGTQTDDLEPQPPPLASMASPPPVRTTKPVDMPPAMPTPPEPRAVEVGSEGSGSGEAAAASTAAATEEKEEPNEPAVAAAAEPRGAAGAAAAAAAAAAGSGGCSKKSKRRKAKAAAAAAAAASTGATPEVGGLEPATHEPPPPPQPQSQQTSLQEELSFSGGDFQQEPSPSPAATAAAQKVGRASSPPPPPSLVPTQPYSPYASPRAAAVAAAAPSSSSEPTFNELLASTAASARTRGAGGPTHGPLRPEAPPAASTIAAAAAAAALLANVPPPTPPAAAVGEVVHGMGSSAAGVSAAPAAAAAPPPAVAAAAAIPRAPSPAQPEPGVAAVIGSGNCSSGNLSRSTSASTTSSSTATNGGGTAAAAAPPPRPPLPAKTSSSSTSASSSRGMIGLPGQRYGNGGLFGFPSPSVQEEGPRPQGPVCRWYPGRSPALRRSFVLGERAGLAAGWDIIDVEELTFDGDMWATLSDPRSGVGTQLPLAAGGLLQDVDWASGCFYLLLDGHLLAERPAGPPGGGGPEDGPPPAGPGPGGAAGGVGPGPGGLRQGRAAVQESALIAPGSLISCAAFLSSTAARCKVVALEPARLVAFSWQTLEALVVDSPTLLIRLLVAASAALGPVVRRFISLGLNRVWLESGDVAYRQGDFAECLYVVISGRLRLLHETMHPVTHARQLHLEEEVGRGEAVGAVWAITGGHHDTTALCVRDSELVRMSRSAFRVISADSPLALSKLFSNIARRLVAAWDSRVRSDRGASSSNAAATSSAAAAAAAAAGVGGGVGGAAATGALRGAGLPQLPNPARLGLTPLKSVGQLAASGGVVRGPRPSGRRGEIVTIAILPAGVLPDAAAAATMASALAGSPTDVAAASAALAAAEAASMGSVGGSVGGGIGGSGTGRAGSYSGLMNGAVGTAAATSGSWRWPPGLSKQAAALATLTAIKRLSGALKDALSPFGPVLLLDATVLSLQFPTASERLDVLFYRSKVTSWMAAQEEEYRFILLEADVAASPWSSVCVAQADCILLVAPEGSTPQLSQPESLLVFNAASPAFARPKPRRTGLTPSALSAGMTPAASSAYLAGAAAAAAAAGSPSRFPTTVSASGVGGGGGAAPPSPSQSPPSRASSASLSAAAAAPPLPQPPPPAVAGGVGGSHHPHHLYGAAQQLYGASSAAMLRRVELVLLHPGDGSTPSRTADWLAGRPSLSRHHHIRLGRPTDIQRLARYMAGKTVGIVLSGGGSRGLAHLGVLTALEDAGVPLDAVGGTSQGAFMAALYAQGLGREALNLSVRHYAHQLSSVRHLLSDITLPVLSLFSGSAFDQAVRRVFERGAQRLEDLWLPFFCVTTNLTRGEASVHTEGTLWKLVRASMTIVGLLPPVWEDGCLLVDGGYMNNMPVDVMRSMMGVDSVIVVDVEGRDDMGWRSLTPYDGGLSGWRLLWDRLCPIPRWRFTAAAPPSGPGSSRSGGGGGGGGAPRYAALISKLTAMTHVANLKRVAVEHRIDLYLRPPGLGGFRLMDFHLMDRIVKDAYRYATSAITQWKQTHRVGPFGIEDTPPQPPPPATTPLAAPLGPVEVGPSGAAPLGGAGGGGGSAAAAGGGSILSPAISAVVPAGAGATTGAGAAGTPGGGAGSAAVPSCMTQLQKKQQPAAAVLAAVTASVGGSVPAGGVPFVAPPPAALRRPMPPPPGAVTAPPPQPQAPPRLVAMKSCPPPASSPARSQAIPVATSVPHPSGAKPVVPSPSATVVRFAERVLISPVDYSTPSDGREAEAEAEANQRMAPAGPAPSSDGVVEAAAAADAQQQQQPSTASSQASALRPVLSRMARSATRHSLLDLQRADSDD